MKFTIIFKHQPTKTTHEYSVVLREISNRRDGVKTILINAFVNKKDNDVLGFLLMTKSVFLQASSFGIIELFNIPLYKQLNRLYLGRDNLFVSFPIKVKEIINKNEIISKTRRI